MRFSINVIRRRLGLSVSRVSVFLLGLLGLTSVCMGNDGPPTKAKNAAVATIGSTVFNDYNKNGIQDTGEPGIDNVRVQLFERGVFRGTTTTTNGGLYTFADPAVKANTAYELRVTQPDFPTGLNLTQTITNGDPTRNNDARLIGSTAVVSLTTGSAASTNDSFSFGFAAGSPDVAIVKTATNSQVTLGSNNAFTIQVTNGPGSSISNVVVRDTIDAGLVYVGSSPVGGSPTTTTTLSGSGATVVVWNIGTLAPNATGTLSLTVNARSEGVLFNTAVVTADGDADIKNNISRACFTVPVRLCQGERFVATISANVTNIQWYRDGAAITGANTANLTITQAGSYSYTATAYGDCAANSCCPIIVYNGSVPNLAIVPASTSLCIGQSVALTATGCTSGTLAWSTGAAGVASITVAPTSTTVYSATCSPTSSSVCPAVVSTTVTVNPSVTATIAVAPSATICAGQSVSLTASGGASYTWNTGATGATLPVSPTVTTTYTVTAISAQGCSGTATQTLTVSPTPSLSVNNPTICQNGSATLVVTGCTAGTVVWSTGDIGATLLVTPLATEIYSASCTNGTGCSAVISSTVTVGTAPAYGPLAITATAATCTGSQPNPDASIAVGGLVNTVRAELLLNGTLVQTQATISGNVVTFAGITNSATVQNYTVRLYSASNCTADVSVPLNPANCECPTPKCLPVIIRRITE